MFPLITITGVPSSCFFNRNMNNLLVICTSLMLFSTGNCQTVEYATRFRNFSIESETGSIHLISFNLYQHKTEHRISAAVNLTEDIHIKNIEAIFNRCSFEKYDCENFQKWKFTRNLKSIVYMRNQMWTPAFDHVTPKLDEFPFIRKNVYQSKDVSADATVAVKFYPEVVNYFWRSDIILNDHNDRKAVVIKYEVVFMSFVKRDRTRTRGDKLTTKTKK